MGTKSAPPFVSSDEEDETNSIESKPQRKSSGASNSKADVASSYRDYYSEDTKNIQQTIPCPKGKRRGPRGGVVVPFPVKLYNMLEGVEQEGLEHVVSWQVHGRCFIVHRSKEFVEDVMPRYFRQSKLTSFQRQLNLYGFMRITQGRDRGGYYHELFLKGRPDLCKIMLRTRVKGGSKGGSLPETEPNFYAMPYCTVKDEAMRSSPVISDCASKPTDKTDEEAAPACEFHEALTMLPPQITSCGLTVSAAESNEIPELRPLVLPTEVLPDVSLQMLWEPIQHLLPMRPEQSDTTSKPLPCPYPLASFDFSQDISSHSRMSSDRGDGTGYFAGQRFRCMDDASLDAFESSMIHNIHY